MFSLPRSVIFLSIASFFTDVASDSVYPILPVFLAATLGASPIALGLIEGTAEATASVLKFFSGWLSDRIGKKKGLVFVGYSLSTLSKPLLGLVGTWPQALGIRFLDRLGKGLRTAPRDAWLAQSTEKALYPKVYGFHRGMDHAGAIVGPLLAMAFLSYYPDDYRSLFLWTLVPGVIALFFIGAAKEDLVRKSEPVGQVGKASWRELPGVLRKYFVCLGFFSLANSTDAFLIIRLKDLGVSTAHISLWWAMLHVVKMLSSFAAPFVIGKVGTRNSILFGWGLFSGVYFLFASLDSAPILICAFLIYGVFYGLTEIPERSFIAKMASENRRGAAFGIYAMTLGLSVLPASLMFGAIWQEFGYATAFLVSGTLALLASLMLAFRLPNV